MGVGITYDPAKSERNEHERRYQVLGFIGDRLYAEVFTPRAGKVHVISLRKANKREVKQYAQKVKS